MKLNNRGFLLYEALISLVVLSSFIIFYTSLIQITQKQQYYNKIHFEALMAFKASIYNKAENNTYLQFNEPGYVSEQNKGEYCIIYEEYNKQQKICTK
ncbi:MAG: hypothetical protein ACK5HR_00655 [Mycoplasmatales bacterium]